MEFPNYKKIEDLKELLINTLKPLITEDFVLLDVPNHRNIGDSLIWEGELELFKHFNYKCKYSSNAYTYDRDKISSSDIILLHGGGNFGDIYIHNQEFRLRVLREFPNNKIIFLPQTVYYKDKDLLLKHIEEFKKHKNLFICVRDLVSEKIMIDNGYDNNLLLLPDCAFCLDFTEWIDTSLKNKTLYLKRTDSELNEDFTIDESKNIDVKDWPTFSDVKLFNKIQGKYESEMHKLSEKFLKYTWLVDSEFGLLSKKSKEKNIRKGVRFINSYDLIFTTRLHGFILSVLLNKEVKILDNSYGKNANFYNTWMQDFDSVELLKK